MQIVIGAAFMIAREKKIVNSINACLRCTLKINKMRSIDLLGQLTKHGHDDNAPAHLLIIAK